MVEQNRSNLSICDEGHNYSDFSENKINLDFFFCVMVDLCLKYFFTLVILTECCLCSIRVPTSSGNPGKCGKSHIKVPCMEKSWNLKKI